MSCGLYLYMSLYFLTVWEGILFRPVSGIHSLGCLFSFDRQVRDTDMYKVIHYYTWKETTLLNKAGTKGVDGCEHIEKTMCVQLRHTPLQGEIMVE